MEEVAEKVANLALELEESSSTISAVSRNSSISALAAPASAPKTPVSLLQELYVRKGITPKYDLVQIEGAVHEPTFKYRVSVVDLVATGCGQSKKKAKHTAALAMLDKLRTAQQQPSSVNSTALVTVAKAAKVVEIPKDLETELMSPHDDGIDGNPVGDLQEMCMNRRMAPPVYEVGLEKGAPHERCFVIVCSVGGSLKESGSGKSKKLSKRQAAYKMLQTLKSMPVDRDSDPTLAMMDEDDLAQGIAKKSAQRENGGQSMQLLKFHRDLKINRGEHLASLHDEVTFEVALEAAPEDMLEKVADEQDFEVTYVEVEEKSKDDKYHCFVQLSTNPVAVCFGVGDNAGRSKANSASNALQYLRIMTK
jgi:RISC-loading complex subunit TARBP2